MAMQEDNGGREAAPVVQNKLQVCHGLISLVDQRPVLCALSLVPVVDLVHHVGDLREVHIQPGGVLHKVNRMKAWRPAGALWCRASCFGGEAEHSACHCRGMGKVLNERQANNRNPRRAPQWPSSLAVPGIRSLLRRSRGRREPCLGSTASCEYW